MTRRFEINEAKREQVPLLIGIAGPSYSGKTFSALRLAAGIAKVNGGPIVYIDTEGRRALHYADEFNFKHIPFSEPYGSLDYVAAIDAALDSDPAVIVVDSASHEHEGTGGYLDLANKELESGKKEGQHWAKPSVARRRLLSRIQTLPCSAIFCFRAKEALDWKQVFAKKAKTPPPMGETIVGTADFSFEMTVRFLLHAGSQGFPTWQTDFPGEKQAIKLPKQFHSLFSGNARQISEADGEAMARWARGDTSQSIPAASGLDLETLSEQMRQADSIRELAALGAKLKGAKLTAQQRSAMTALYNQSKARLEQPAAGAAAATGQGSTDASEASPPPAAKAAPAPVDLVNQTKLVQMLREACPEWDDPDVDAISTIEAWTEEERRSALEWVACVLSDGDFKKQSARPAHTVITSRQPGED